MIRHNISDIALEDLLELIDCHVPRTLNMSKYKFLKEFPNIANIRTFYYCPDCLILLNFGIGRRTVCTSCHKVFLQNSLKRNGHYFLYIPLKDQLSSLFSGPLFNELQRDCREQDILSDVTSGRIYKKLREKGIISGYDISLQWNADGVQTFKSSKVSMCPLQVSINELHYRLRKENILLAGMWAATEKPVLDLFLKPFIDELKDLHTNGFECLPPNFEEPVTIKVHTILAPVDSVERCALQNIHQFNGRYGCSLCLNPGEHVSVGNGYTRIYRGEGTKRTENQHRRDTIKAEAEKTIVNGVKGVSLLMLLPVFNIVKSFPPEYMHCVLLGVVKLFLSTWIDPKNCRKPWYIGTKSQLLDNRLLKILPPCEITRTPQSVSNLSQWKASELKNFLLYYSLPCLKDLLPSVFYKHWSLLVYAIHVFDSEKIDIQAYETATRAIKKFVNNIEKLYGMAELMKFNVHLLLHIPQSIKDFGALWAWSAFPYEGYNTVLRNMLHSSQTILQQMCKSYLRLQTVKYIDTFSKANCSVEGKNLYLKMLRKYRNRTGHRTIDDNNLILFGNGRIVSLNLVEKLSIELLITEHIQNHAVLYERFIFNNVLYHSSTYEKLYKRDNSIVETTSGNFMKITGIVSVTTLNEVNKYVIIGNSFEVLNDVLCTYSYVSSLSYSHSVRETNHIMTCLPQNIRNKCILVPCNNESYIMKLVNKIETD